MFTLTPSCFSFTIPALSSSVTMNLKVPGTFNGITADASNGVWMTGITVWSDVPSVGDTLTAMSVSDNDGVLPAPLRGNFPNYPVIMPFSVSGDANAGLFLPSSLLFFPAILDTGISGIKFIPSGLYIVATFTAGNGVLGAGRIVRANALWGQISS